MSTATQAAWNALDEPPPNGDLPQRPRTTLMPGVRIEPLAQCAARLCRQAGADEALIPQWADEGRRRAAAARLAPFSGL